MTCRQEPGHARHQEGRALPGRQSVVRAPNTLVSPLNYRLLTSGHQQTQSGTRVDNNEPKQQEEAAGHYNRGRPAWQGPCPGGRGVRHTVQAAVWVCRWPEPRSPLNDLPPVSTQ
ncbi:hypothetical protein ACOMHN_031185 [Nucella lapillus]